jgi:cell division septal protein FtsQ
MTKTDSHNNPKSSKAANEGSKKPLPWIAGAILVLGLAVLAGFYWNSNLKVEEITYSGNHFIPTEDLTKVNVPTGVSPDSIDFGKIMSRFEQLPYVEQVNISVAPNGNLMVNIDERTPIALLADGSTKIYIDKYGVRLPLVLGKTVDVPILYGFSAKPMSDTLQSDAFKTVTNFLTAIRNKPVSNATISEVAWTPKEGIVALTNQNGVKLIVGKGDFETRLRNWEAFYGEVIKEKGIEAMRSVDLRFKGQIVTREK